MFTHPGTKARRILGGSLDTSRAGFKPGIFFALLTSIDPFDQFRDPTGQKLASDRKSLTYTLTYRAPDRTLETAEVDTAHQALLASLEKALPVTLRK